MPCTQLVLMALTYRVTCPPCGTQVGVTLVIAALEGVTALLAMHASCAAGIAVVGIDNGFGAACAVARMLP